MLRLRERLGIERLMESLRVSEPVRTPENHRHPTIEDYDALNKRPGMERVRAEADELRRNVVFTPECLTALEIEEIAENPTRASKEKLKHVESCAHCGGVLHIKSRAIKRRL